MLSHRVSRVGLLVRMDEEGRIRIPEEVRARLGAVRVFRLELRGKELVLVPLEDPLERLTRLAEVEVRDVEAEIRELRKIAEEEIKKAVRERWG